MWRFISCFVSKWFTAGKIIKSPGLYAESQIHHENCIARYFQLKSQCLLRWGHVTCNKPRHHPCLWGGKSLCWDAHMHDDQIHYLRKTSHLMMFFGAHREELYWLELRVSFVFLFSCKNNHNCECFRLELVSSQWPPVEIERSLSLGLKCQSRCFCETWGPHPPHTFHPGSSFWWNARDS